MASYPAPIITAQLGNNRASQLYAVGETIAINVSFKASPNATWELTRDGKATKPDSVTKTEASGVTTLAFSFGSGAANESGFYLFKVTDAGKSAQSFYDLLCRSVAPVIKQPKDFKIFDPTKGSIKVSASYKGQVEFHNWLARDIGDDDNFTDITESNPGFENQKSIEFNGAQMLGKSIELQTCLFLDSTGVIGGDVLDDYAQFGVIAKTSKDLVAVGKPPAEVSRVGDLINLSFKSKTPIASCYLIRRQGRFLQESHLNNLSFTRDGDWYVYNVQHAYANASAPDALPAWDFIIYVPATQTAVYIGRTAIKAAPVIEQIYPNAPITVAADTQLTLVAPKISGTAPIKVTWYFSSDAQRSWKEIGTGELIKYTAETSGVVKPKATNAYGSDFMDSVITLVVTPRPVGTSKKSGQK